MTVRRIAGTFLSGLVVILPLLITAALLIWLVGTAETVLGTILRVLIPDEHYHRGFGLLAALVTIFAVGVLMQAVYFRHVMTWFERQVDRIPLIKTVYGAVRDLMALFSKGGAQQFNKAVLVRVPALDAQVMGFITREDFSDLPFRPADGAVAVYLPMSYQIGGYTLFLRRDQLTPVPMGLEAAMRFVVTAGMSKGDVSRPSSAHSGTSGSTG